FNGLLEGLMGPAIAVDPPEIKIVIEEETIETTYPSFEKDAENIQGDFSRAWGLLEDGQKEQSPSES
ncbi:MAG: hypothetical protein LUC43_02790, partial [Burkholderiales bacterium]|nr:hypothetical protein [Burkholderiales bacterium]